MAKSSKTRRPYGSGSVRDLGGGRWEVRATHGRRADGRPRQLSRVVHGDKADAEAALVRLRLEMGASPNLADCMTLDEYFWGVFLPSREAGPRSTYDTYRSVYRVDIAPAFGDWPADRIGRGDVQRWVRRLPPSKAEKAHRHLRAILRAMFDEELLDEEPLRRRVKIPRHQKAPTAVWGPGELAEALDRLRGHQLEGIVLAMAGGGLRREEALALDLPRDLAFAETSDGVVCRFMVDDAWADGEPQRGETKTYRVRPVTIAEPFASRLMAVVSDGRPKLLMRLDGRAPLRPSSVPETWRRAFREGEALHGLRYVELRSLRHCHETIAARAGLTDAENAMLHGHSQQVMYGHYLTIASDAADRMARAVGRAVREDLGRIWDSGAPEDECRPEV